MPLDAPAHDPLHRYHRQMLLEGIGREGQQRLAESHAVVVGCGALGCGVADLLARAGVGTLTIIDRDVVEATNLQRQVLFDERHVRAALPKAEAARQRLAEINSQVRAIAQVADLSARTLPSLLPTGAALGAAPGVLIDGTDNFETRLLLNDLAVSRRIPYVYAGVLSTRGMVLTIAPWLRGPCLRCLVERPPAPGSTPTCDTLGVLGPAVAHATSLQAGEALKVLLGRSDLLAGDLIEFDLWTSTHRRLPSGGLRDPACVCCAGRDYAYLEGRSGGATTTLCGRGSVQISPATTPSAPLDLGALAERLGRSAQVTRNAFLLRATLSGEASETTEPVSIAVFRDGRAIVSGTTRPERARSLYDRYVGS